MVSPSINVLPLSSLAGQWLPSLGVLLAVAGVLLVYAGKTESPTALVPPRCERKGAKRGEHGLGRSPTPVGRGRTHSPDSKGGRPVDVASPPVVTGLE